jgi:hypothetical protein
MTFLCIKPHCPADCCGCNYAISEQQARAYAIRYAYLRSRPVDTIALSLGGVFAGMVPGNLVLNGADLDAQIDKATGSSGQNTSKEACWLAARSTIPVPLEVIEQACAALNEAMHDKTADTHLRRKAAEASGRLEYHLRAAIKAATGPASKAASTSSEVPAVCKDESAIRTALEYINNLDVAYGQLPGGRKTTDAALAEYYWHMLSFAKQAARKALAAEELK